MPSNYGKFGALLLASVFVRTCCSHAEFLVNDELEDLVSCCQLPHLQEHIIHMLNFELMMSSPQTELTVAQEKFTKENMKPNGGERLSEDI